MAEALEDMSTRWSVPRRRETFMTTTASAGVVRLLSPASPSQRRNPKLKLSDVTEQRVMKSGMRHFFDFLESEGPLDMQFPRRPNGSKLLMRENWLEHLLRQKAELRTSLQGDVSAAQGDLKHLKLHQLVTLRVRTLDFETASRAHEAHRGFLEMADRLVWERLAMRFLQGNNLETPNPEVLRRLGLRTLLVLGVVSLLSGKGRLGASSGIQQFSDEGEASPLNFQLPTCWAMPMRTDNGWPGEGNWSALLKPGTMEMEFVSDAIGREEFAARFVQATGPGGTMAIVCDRPLGKDKDKMLDWEIAVVDPTTPGFEDELFRTVGSVTKTTTPVIWNEREVQQARAGLRRTLIEKKLPPLPPQPSWARSAACDAVVADQPDSEVDAAATRTASSATGPDDTQALSPKSPLTSCHSLTASDFVSDSAPEDGGQQQPGSMPASEVPDPTDIASLGETGGSASAACSAPCQDVAATKIQARARGNADRKRLRQDAEAKELAAKRIQAWMRGNAARTALHQEAEAKELAAKRIQAWMRGNAARTALRQEAEAKEAAATKIQAKVRGHAVRKALSRESQDSVATVKAEVPLEKAEVPLEISCDQGQWTDLDAVDTQSEISLRSPGSPADQQVEASEVLSSGASVGSRPGSLATLRLDPDSRPATPVRPDFGVGPEGMSPLRSLLEEREALAEAAESASLSDDDVLLACSAPLDVPDETPPMAARATRSDETRASSTQAEAKPAKITNLLEASPGPCTGPDHYFIGPPCNEPMVRTNSDVSGQQPAMFHMGTVGPDEFRIGTVGPDEFMIGTVTLGDAPRGSFFSTGAADLAPVAEEVSRRATASSWESSPRSRDGRGAENQRKRSLVKAGRELQPRPEAGRRTRESPGRLLTSDAAGDRRERTRSRKPTLQKPAQSATITGLTPRALFGSRGRATAVELELNTTIGTFCASAPLWSSRQGEDRSLPIEELARIVKPFLLGLDVSDQFSVDAAITKAFRSGAGQSRQRVADPGAMFAVSLAACRAGAIVRRMAFYEYVAKLTGLPSRSLVRLPIPSFHILGPIKCQEEVGGAVTKSTKEFAVVPHRASSFREALGMGLEVFHATKALVKRQYGQDACRMNREGCFRPPVQTANEAQAILQRAMVKAGHDDGGVVIDADLVTSSTACAYVAETERTGLRRLWVQDLTSVSEAITAARLAHEEGFELAVVSRGAAEDCTSDAAAAELAVGLGAARLEAGAPCGSGHVRQYNQILRIEEELGNRCSFGRGPARSPQRSSPRPRSRKR